MFTWWIYTYQSCLQCCSLKTFLFWSVMSSMLFVKNISILILWIYFASHIKSFILLLNYPRIHLLTQHLGLSLIKMSSDRETLPFKNCKEVWDGHKHTMMEHLSRLYIDHNCVTSCGSIARDDIHSSCSHKKLMQLK